MTNPVCDIETARISALRNDLKVLRRTSRRATMRLLRRQLDFALALTAYIARCREGAVRERGIARATRLLSLSQSGLWAHMEDPEIQELLRQMELLEKRLRFLAKFDDERTSGPRRKRLEDSKIVPFKTAATTR